MRVGELMSLIDENDQERFQREVDAGADEKVLAKLLNCAASENSVWAIDHLVSVGTDINGRAGRFKANAITTAAFYDAVEAAERLLSYGARIEDASSIQSPMMKAVSQGHMRMIKWLIDVGCDPNLTYKLGDGSFRNARSYAIECGKTDVAEYLEAIGVPLPSAAEESARQSISAPAAEKNTEAITGYIETNLGSVVPLSAQEIFSPLGEAAVTVHFIEPGEKHRHRTLFSSGPSNLALPVPDAADGYEFAEFVMHLPAEWPDLVEADPKWQWPISYFKQIAYMPHLKQKWIGPRSIIAAVDIEPDWPSSPDLTHATLAPDLVPPLTGDRIVHFYTIIPMTQQAQQLGINGGPARIVSAIESGELDVTEAWRRLLPQ